MMEITEDILSTIYTRAKEFATTKYGSEPNYIRLEGDCLEATWVHYCYGDRDEKSEYIYAKDLVVDLEEVAKKRAEELEKQRIENEKQAKIREDNYKKQQKENRRQEYLKLKKEFE